MCLVLCVFRKNGILHRNHAFLCVEGEPKPVTVQLYTCAYVAIHHIQVNTKFCELKGGTIGIAAQVTRSGMSHKHRKYYIVVVSQKSCFVSYVIVKSPSKPYNK